ncbi:PepSY domain-containing protein [Streptomyces sp. NPDC055709]
MKRNVIITAAAAVALVAGAGGAVALSGNDDTTAAKSSTAAGERESRTTGDGSDDRDKGAAAAAPAAPLTVTARSLPAQTGLPQVVNAEQAASAALKKVPGTVDSVDRDDNSRGWDVDILGKDGRWYDLRVTSNGTVRQDNDRDHDGDDRDDRVALRGAKLTALQAAEAAKSIVPGTVVSIDFDEDGNRHHWDVEVRDAKGRVHDLAFDADKAANMSGQPARVQADDDHDDHDDD